MICPFCKNKLELYVYRYNSAYSCENKNCLNDDMTRFQVSYNNYPTFLLSMAFMLDNYYAQIDFVNKVTLISKLEAFFLFDTVQIPVILKFNYKFPEENLKRIKNLLVFT